jgi:hypothetical protein
MPSRPIKVPGCKGGSGKEDHDHCFCSSDNECCFCALSREEVDLENLNVTKKFEQYFYKPIYNKTETNIISWDIETIKTYNSPSYIEFMGDSGDDGSEEYQGGDE